MFVSIKMANGCFRLNILVFMVIKKYREFVFEKMKIIPLSDEDFEKIPVEIGPKYKYFPKTKEELQSIIRERMDKDGNKCDLNDIDTSEIMDMSDLFRGQHLQYFNGNISKWNVSKVESMDGMFCDSLFDGDISRWDVSNVKNMEKMFWESYFNNDISKWNVSKVENMSYMFWWAKRFNSDISEWDVSNVENMKSMFDHDKAFNQDISKWNVCNVTNMDFMFRDTDFNQNISGWNVCNVTTHVDMFYSNPIDIQPNKQPKFNK